ncbi:MAG: sigma-70 family RNA polymerase sigma factor, partial [Myxococcales bacterium]|nr:sigma-70 family RNA polymerase sigma factor [Myxococcales bacterium]
MTDEAARRAIEVVVRVEAPRLMGGLVRFTRDLGRAEDLVQEALVAALETWPTEGVPKNPGAWLMAVAKRRALDVLRHERAKDRSHGRLEAGEARAFVPDDCAPDDVVGDDVLRLVLATCHPVLSREARVALTLRYVAGLGTAEIARAFLTTEPTMAQRLVRAKRSLAEARVPFDVPKGEDLRARLGPVLEVVYLTFNEGYSATSGDAVVRSELCDEAMRLARVVVGLFPHEAEAHGLLALLELQASRARARVAHDGTPILLADQDRRLWDRLLVTRGLEGLRRAEGLAAPLGPYTLQAAIAAVHARATDLASTDFVAMVGLYDALVALTGSPVVELNRAVAVGMAYGPEEALELALELAQEPALAAYPYL